MHSAHSGIALFAPFSSWMLLIPNLNHQAWERRVFRSCTSLLDYGRALLGPFFCKIHLVKYEKYTPCEGATSLNARRPLNSAEGRSKFSYATPKLGLMIKLERDKEIRFLQLHQLFVSLYKIETILQRDLDCTVPYRHRWSNRQKFLLHVSQWLHQTSQTPKSVYRCYSVHFEVWAIPQQHKVIKTLTVKCSTFCRLQLKLSADQ